MKPFKSPIHKAVDAMHYSYAVRCEPRQMSPNPINNWRPTWPKARDILHALTRRSLNITRNNVACKSATVVRKPVA